MSVDRRGGGKVSGKSRVLKVLVLRIVSFLVFVG